MLCAGNLQGGNRPGVYTQVTKFSEWVHQQTKGQRLGPQCCPPVDTGVLLLSATLQWTLVSCSSVLPSGGHWCPALQCCPPVDTGVLHFSAALWWTLRMRTDGNRTLSNRRWMDGRVPMDVTEVPLAVGNVKESRCGKQKHLYCSRLTLRSAQPQNTGYFRCRYRHNKKQASLYVYRESPDVVYMKEGKPLVFPCRVTAPHTPVSLVKFPGQKLIAEQENITWDSKKGFIIPNPSFRHIGLFSCESSINGVVHSMKYLTHRQAEWNSRVSITWSYPGQSTSSVMFHSVLSIALLTRADRGIYVCHVQSGPTSRKTNTSVTVYDRPFIRLKHRHGPVVDAIVGQKLYRLSPKLRAFPTPEVIWLKDGMVAAERCSRYHVEGNSLLIRDVAEEDAGLYTVLVGIQQHSLYRNLTLSLVVNAKPQIAEKAVSLKDPGTFARGSRQALLCTAQGFPPPHIRWLWHPCPQRGPCELPAFTERRPIDVKANVTSAENSILSVAQRQEVLEGKEKTVGVLMVAAAAVSGVYRCIASNSVGEDMWDIRFYVTDVPGGFDVGVEEEPREGSDVHLACRANKHLYRSLSWRRATPLNGPEPQGPAPLSELWTGEFSHTLRLSLTNLTVEDSGTYSCSAKNLLSGEELHLETQLKVIALEAPVLLQNLSDCSVNVSSSVTLSCTAHGVPHPQVTWYKDHRRLQQGSGIMLAAGGGTLHIERITAEDEGMYTCEATNERGSVESSAYIWVDDSASSSLEIPTLTCTCVVATLFWLLLTLVIRKLKQPSSQGVKTDYLSIILAPGEGPLDEQCDRLPYDPGQWEFPRDRLKLEKPLGRGAFGKVMQASAFGISNSSSCRTVAVKMLKDGATPSEHKALMTELKILIHIGHHLNVVNLLGACTKPGGPLMVIVEYCRYGNLSTYLKSKRDMFLHKREPDGQKPAQPDGQKRRLASVSSSTSSSSSGNILLSENSVVKICDFGLARDVYKDPDYVRKGDARLPLKWMSPESIFDKVFTTQSDVWSFGVLLWEIFSLGASPYPGLHIDEEFCHRLRAGTRMRAPEYSTPEIYNTMLSCWRTNPVERPTFTELVGTLGDLLQQRVQQEGKDYIPLNNFLPLDEKVTELSSLQPSGLNCYNLESLRSGSTQPLRSPSTFEEPPHTNRLPADYQTDSGMVLPSEELQCVKWSDRTKALPSNGFLAASKSRECLPSAVVRPCVYSAPSGQEDEELPTHTTYTTLNTSPHLPTLPYTPPHLPTLPYTSPHCHTPPYTSPLLPTPLTLPHTSLHLPTLPYTSLYLPSPPYSSHTSPHIPTLPYTTLHLPTPSCNALHLPTLPYTSHTSLYLPSPPYSSHTSPHCPTPPYTSPHRSAMPYTSPHLPTPHHTSPHCPKPPQ
ncbi:hypothetical protein JZ751_025521 [Albula glossodonta]|uniref:receptor protein-tyrosine kinase n=1 Tax=Albula glossodonta TaxID=121402 RepID=A0A8T2MXL4_9TELE|nr:hypothetical protein JZ751_025521 [Albula glossodonta]